MHGVNIYKSFFKNYKLSIHDSVYLFLENENEDKNLFHGLNTLLSPIGIKYDEVSESVYEVDMSVKLRVCKADQVLVNVEASLGNYVYMDAKDHHSFIKQLYLAVLPDVYKILINKLNNNLVKSNLNRINFPGIDFNQYYSNALEYLNKTGLDNQNKITG